jgi:rRNA maturation endonuclease Nob1
MSEVRCPNCDELVTVKTEQHDCEDCGTTIYS